MTLSVCKSQSRQQIDAVSCVCKLSKASIETCKLWSAQLFSREYKRAAQRLQTRCPVLHCADALPSSAQFCTNGPVLHVLSSSAQRPSSALHWPSSAQTAQFWPTGPVLHKRPSSALHWPSSAQTAQFCPVLHKRAAQFCTTHWNSETGIRKHVH